MDEEVNENNISKLNSGGLINLRLHNLWVDRHKHAQAGNYSGWNEILDAIWCELAADVKEDSDEDKKFWTLSKAFSLACSGEKKMTGFKKIDNSQRVVKTSQKISLIKKEIFLRRLQNKQGKGTAYVDEDDFD
jgi:hypothetical protein